MTRTELNDFREIGIGFEKGKSCYRCGEWKSDIKKDYVPCSVYGTFYEEHLFKIKEKKKKK